MSGVYAAAMVWSSCRLEYHHTFPDVSAAPVPVVSASTSAWQPACSICQAVPGPNTYPCPGHRSLRLLPLPLSRQVSEPITTAGGSTSVGDVSHSSSKTKTSDTKVVPLTDFSPVWPADKPHTDNQVLVSCSKQHACQLGDHLDLQHAAPELADCRASAQPYSVHFSDFACTDNLHCIPAARASLAPSQRYYANDKLYAAR